VFLYRYCTLPGIKHLILLVLFLASNLLLICKQKLQYMEKFMKISTITLFILFASVISLNAAWNPCISAKRQKAYRKLPIQTEDMETCFVSVVSLLDNRKTKKRGIELLTKFMYQRNEDFVTGAIIALGNSSSPDAIRPLKQKGINAIKRNNTEEAEQVTNALINLKGHSAIYDMVNYAKRRRRQAVKVAIRDEYLAFTTGKHFRKMESLAGRVLE